MLLKYLNELDDAVRLADQNPDAEALSQCAERLRVLEDYLDSQIEPVRRRGQEIIGTMVPPDLYARIHHVRVPMAAGYS